ncbi:KAP family P-loop NTPase fold protein [Gaopeijia maritima]|uniref:P-loop NTPase fold protein n=1 Tax=Gaopeijia maritima TaxID=3119007 RepID=A0ABU9EAN1_9BACT
MLRRSPPLNPTVDEPFRGDALDRKGAVENLVAMLESVQGPAVIAVDAPWGFGKTTFLRMAQASIESADGRSVYFNAWEADIASEPLLSFAAAVDRALPSAGKEGDNVSLVGAIARISGRAALRALEFASSGVFKEADWDNPDGVPLLGSVDAIAAERLSINEYERGALAEAKALLARRVKAHSAGGITIFVDELDRCKPDYAVQLLECLKHLFDVPGVVFVLGVNQAELAHSVGAVYGSGFGGRRYLGRFIDMTYRLPEPDLAVFVDARIRDAGWDAASRWPPDPAAQNPAVGLASIARGFRFSLRDVEQFLSELDVLLAVAPPPVSRSLAPAVSFLVALRRHDPDDFEDFLYSESGRVSDMVLRLGSSFSESDFGRLVSAGLLLIREDRTEANQLRERVRSMRDSYNQLQVANQPGSFGDAKRLSEWFEGPEAKLADILHQLTNRLGSRNRESKRVVTGLLDFTSNLTFPASEPADEDDAF